MRNYLLAAVVVLLCLASGSPRAGEPPHGAHAFSFTSIEGAPLPLERFAGAPLLVVNTASLCGFTYQYAALQRVWERYRARGLVVLGVPSNDFGRQEPGSNEAIKEFCDVNFDVDFPLTQKEHVKGPQAHPLFAWLRAQRGAETEPRWNFTKYLIGADGRLLGSWPSSTEPDDAAITSAILKALAPGAS